MTRPLHRWLMAALLSALAPLDLHAAGLRSELLDDFRAGQAWQASASDQVQARLRRDGDGSLCLDYDFAGVSGYAVMRRALPMDWPEHFELVLRYKGQGGRNDLQIKLVDASGDNVWWVNRRDSQLPAQLSTLRLRQRHVEFAWGPTPERRLRQTQFIEFVIAAGRDGGRGSLCLARLALQERAPDPAVWPEARLRVGPGSIDHDFGLMREFNGVTLRWPAGQRPPDYELLASDDGHRWRLLRRVVGSPGGLDTVFLPDSTARHLRVANARGASLAPRLALVSAAHWPDFNAMLTTLAAEAPRGDLPRAFVGQQNYWTLVGVDGGGQRSALLSEDGALEVGRGGFSVEPAVQLADGTRITWAAVQTRHSLRDGALPLPSVHWQHPAFALDIEAGADGPSSAPQLLAQYRLHNRSDRSQTFTLMLAIRPWQVNPPQQFLSTPGGASALRRLQWDGSRLGVDGPDGRHWLRWSTPPQRLAALALDGGVSLAALQGALRDASQPRTLDDPQAHASALLQWRITLAPGASQTLAGVATLASDSGPGAPAAITAAAVAARLDAAAAQWQQRLGRVVLQGPAEVTAIADSLRSSLAQMLMSRDGPALRPGTRSYARTWIRDGAMMVAALVRLGELDAAREFTDWYATHIFASGKVPCCVDQRGADPVVENDSHGQYLFAVAEVMRHGGGAAWAAQHWPQVQRVMAWMEALRQSERGPANQTPERSHLFGLLPPSISHEGYSDKPAYAYWDDFWALRGYKDAVQLAQALGHAEPAARWAGWRDEFERELVASIGATARQHGIDFIAGAADRGDFDATSTTIALNPAQADVARALLDATFERYWQEASARSEGRRAWKDYTPYELRNVGALARLGQPERAHALLAFIFKDQRPTGWNQWAEVVLPDPRQPQFLGDMPHAWVASDYIRSALDLFAYEDERQAALVIGAGWRSSWLQQGDLRLSGLSTPHGRLDLALLRQPGGWRLNLPSALAGLSGGLRLRWPADLPLPRALLDGRQLEWQGRELTLPAPPLSLELRRE